MPNSSGLSRRGGGTVTIIEEGVRRNTTRNAKISACVTFVAVTLLSATVLASKWQPILAGFVGILIGLAAAFVVAVVVLIWPVVRAIWWWLPEIALAFALVASWVWLADHVHFPYLLGVVTLIVGIPASIPQVRRLIASLAWCLILRHRIRTCFAEFIVYNRTGSLPLVLWCIPTPVGARIWVHLRPGLSLDAIQTRLPQIATACWATSATATAASDSNSAYIRIDIKRRDALTGTVASPLLGHIIPGLPGRKRDTAAVPTALDLPDVSPAEVTPQKPAPSPSNGSKKDNNAASAAAPAVTDTNGQDISDWL
jgi:hypothetical protein